MTRQKYIPTPLPVNAPLQLDTPPRTSPAVMALMLALDLRDALNTLNRQREEKEAKEIANIHQDYERRYRGRVISGQTNAPMSDSSTMTTPPLQSGLSHSQDATMPESSNDKDLSFGR